MTITGTKNNNQQNVEQEKWDNEELATVRIKVLKGHEDSVNSCQLIQDTAKAMTASTDGSVRLWNFKTGQCVKVYSDLHQINIPQARALTDGSKFVTCGWDKKLKLTDGETGQCILEKDHEDFLTCCQLSHNGKLIAVGSDLSKALRIYDIESGEIVHDLKNHHLSTITSCKFSPEDDKVITTSMDKSTKFFDIVSGTTTITLGGHTNIVSCCSISHDERKFATASWDKTIQIWDVATGMYRSKGPTTLRGSHDGSISCCDFSNDGLFLVTGSYDMSIVVWDVENDVQKLKLQGHFDWINDICFSDDQDWILSCSKDRTVRLWSIQESDKIPIVLENRQAHGLKVIKCSKCGKPFSMSQLESFRDVTVCVFCRLASPEKSWLSFSDVSDHGPGSAATTSNTNLTSQ